MPVAKLVVWSGAQHVLRGLGVRGRQQESGAVGHTVPHRPAGVARQLLVTVVHREERWRKCPEQCWGKI